MNEQYSKEEVLDMFMANIRLVTRHWSMQKGLTDKERCEGLASSILTTIDGRSGGFPCALDLVARPHPDDKQFAIDNDDKYIEDGTVINDCLLNKLFAGN